MAELRISVATRTTSEFCCPPDSSPYVSGHPPAALPDQRVPRYWSRAGFDVLACFGRGSAISPSHLRSKPSSEVLPTFVAQSAVAALYLESPSVGTGHPRHLSAPPAQVTEAPANRHSSGIATPPNAAETTDSTILGNGHSISIGTCGRELKWIHEDEEDRAGA